jgi:hypothetical protein
MIAFNNDEKKIQITVEDIAKLFYLLLKQNQRLHPGGKLSFDTKAFKNMPQKLVMNFENKSGRLFCWIPEKPSDRKKKNMKVVLPDKRIFIPELM